MEKVDTSNGPRTLYDGLSLAMTTGGMRTAGPINTIVLLSYGSDDGSSTAQPNDVKRLFESSDPPVQVVAVSYGPTHEEFKENVIKPSIGRQFDGNYKDIAAVSKFVCGFL